MKKNVEQGFMPFGLASCPLDTKFDWFKVNFDKWWHFIGFFLPLKCARYCHAPPLQDWDNIEQIFNCHNRQVLTQHFGLYGPSNDWVFLSYLDRFTLNLFSDQLEIKIIEWGSTSSLWSWHLWRASELRESLAKVSTTVIHQFVPSRSTGFPA